MDSRGNIKVDEFQNTTASKIYALGDVCGKALLTPGIADVMILYICYGLCSEEKSVYLIHLVNGKCIFDI